MVHYPHLRSSFSDIKHFLTIAQLPRVYLIAVKDRKFFKIGRSRSNLGYRLSALQCGCPDELMLLGSTRTPIPNDVEKHLHGLFREKRHRGEWFKLSEDDVKWVLEFLLATNAHVEDSFFAITGGK